MKKFKSILALTASVLALSAFAAPVSAFADNVAFDNTGAGTQTATHNERVAYTVTIPAAVEVNTPDGSDYTGEAIVNVTHKIASGDTLVVTAASTNDKKLKMDENTQADYDAKINGTSIFGSGAKVVDVTGTTGAEIAEQPITINYSAAAADFTKVGTYTDTITFTITYTAASSAP